MKVLLVSNFKPGTGGISGQVELLAQNLAKEGIGVDIFNTKGSFFYRLKCKKLLERKALDFDVLHIHCCSAFGFIPAVLGVTVGNKLKKRTVLTYHGGGADNFFRKHTKLVKHYLCRTDANIVLSGFLGQLFDKYRIPYTVIPNIIELDSSHYKERQTIKPNFISIRTLSPLYNIECILRAFKQVKLQIPEATLRIVGDGPSRASLEEMVKTENIKDVTFVGRVDNKEIYDQLDQADILLSAPRIDNMPVSILEAFNAGLLVISSNVGGVPYMIKNGETGLLFESDNSIELAEQMLFSLSHVNNSLSMVINAHNTLKEYSYSKILPALLRLYNVK